MSIYVRPDLEGMTVAAIREFCREHKIKGYSRYSRKASLIEFVETAMLEKFLEEDLLEGPTEELEGDRAEESFEAIGTSEYVPCPFCESAKAAGKFCDWCDGTGMALSPFTTQGEPQCDSNPEVEGMFHLESEVSERQCDRNPEVEGMFHLESEVSEPQCDRNPEVEGMFHLEEQVSEPQCDRNPEAEKFFRLEEQVSEPQCDCNPEVEGMFHLEEQVSEPQCDRNSQLAPPEPEIKRRLGESGKSLSVFKNRVESRCSCRVGYGVLITCGCQRAITMAGGRRDGI
ncbi:hypothetical protein [Oscillatoria acuminata]|uniref:Rho termination factor N-terminal domain-containing protein n=1 Tax=Oscillatoria acuminata PCC 6304 TaxID=56110 RepID=K9TGU4_9CYAN|nr:hypothetical protein [Oscillatoria acuminata]AFY81239.1 hypothetical protein Oscil6304_1534 [Oscillatoria acuminata PCC 6304]